MKNKVMVFLESMIKKLCSSLKRFPEALMFALATVATLIVLNHGNYSNNDFLGRIAMVLALGIPASLSMKVLIEITDKNISRRIIYLLGIGIALILYYIFLLQEIDFVSSSRYIATTLALYLLFTVIPYYSKAKHYELYIVNLFTRFLVTYLYGVILFAGLAFTLFTINTLFNLNISYKLYFDIWLIVVGIFAPAYFLAEIPKYKQNQEYNDYSKIFKVLLLYIVMPIIVIYTGILYVYFINILFQWQWPEGLVSHLVLWYSIISLIVIIFIQPLKDNKWVNIFTSYFPKVIIPILIMMFMSIGIRINAYGVTENRYFVVATGIWVAMAMLYLSFKSKVKHVYIVTGLIVIAIVSVYGPFSSYSISRFSQNARLDNIFNKYNMIQNGQIVSSSEEIEDEHKQDISSIILYFNNRHNLNDIRAIPGEYNLKDIENILGFEIRSRWGMPHSPREFFRLNTREDGRVINIATYDYFVDFGNYRSNEIEISEEDMKITLDHEEKKLTIVINSEEVYIKQIDEIALNIAREAEGRYELEAKEMIFVDEFNDLEIMYVFDHISGYEDTDRDELVIDFVNFRMFIKLN